MYEHRFCKVAISVFDYQANGRAMYEHRFCKVVTSALDGREKYKLR